MAIHFSEQELAARRAAATEAMRGRAMTLGQTVRVTADGCEKLSRLGTELVQRQ